MKRTKWLLSIIGLLALAGVTLFFTLLPGILDSRVNQVAGDAGTDPSAETLALHNTLTITDLHADTALWNRSLLRQGTRGHVDIPRLLTGNVALQMFTTVTKTPQGQNYESNSADSSDVITLLGIAQGWPKATRQSLTARALYQAGRVSEAANASEAFTLITSQAQLDALLLARAEGNDIIGGLLGTEGSHALDGQLGNIEQLYNAGFRMMSLQHFFDNRLGGSLHGLTQQGLTSFGEQAVDQMTALGIMIDVAHSSEQVVLDVLARTQAPLIVSHTGFRGHCDSTRNISDDTMSRIAARGGLIGVGFWEGAVCEGSIAAIVEALRYGIDTFGLDHIALGSDWDGGIAAPIDASQLARLTQGLVDAHFSDRDIRAVMGGNAIRFFSQHLPP